MDIELYEENLNTMIELLAAVPDLALIDGVFEIELRVRVDDMNTWTVIGYGEAGDPCVLRFEKDPSPVLAKPISPFTINKSDNLLDDLFKRQ